MMAGLNDVLDLDDACPLPWVAVNDTNVTRGSVVRIRPTRTVMDVLAVIIAAQDDDPPWGPRICGLSGRSPGRVYPALCRLQQAGWIEDWRETDPPDWRPRRRYYRLTEDGRFCYRVALSLKPGRRWLARIPYQSGEVQ